MRILITGGAGFIGTHTASLLAEHGHTPVLLDSLSPLSHPSRPTGRPPHVGPHELVIGDVRDPDAVDRALRGVDAVCHLAALVGVGVGVADMPDYAEHNDVGTAVVLSRMAAAGVSRLVLASSIAVYGEGTVDCAEHGRFRGLGRDLADLDAGQFEFRCPECGIPTTAVAVDEDTPTTPRSMYAASKLAQEQQASVWSLITGGTVRCLRYHHVYGPLMPRDTPYSGAPAIFRSQLERGRTLRVFEDGGQQRDFVHVHDVAAATVLALEAPQASGAETYNVGSGEPHTVGMLASGLAAAYGGAKPIVTGEYRLDQPRHILASPAKLVRELGFAPAVGFEQGLKDFATAPLRD